MPLVRVTGVFWRWINGASHRTLHNNYEGQYHITVPKTVDKPLRIFLGELPQRDLTGSGGFTVNIPIERFDGEQPVEPRNLTIRYMGGSSERGDWNFPSQATDPYPLWAPSRGVSNEFDEQAREYIMLIRDEDGRFHARWQRGVDDLPNPLRIQIASRNSGVWLEHS